MDMIKDKNGRDLRQAEDIKKRWQLCTEELYQKDLDTTDNLANLRWIMEKAREFQENIYFCFVDYARAFDCVDHSKLWQVLKEMGLPDHLIYLLRNLYVGQEATVRTG